MSISFKDSLKHLRQTEAIQPAAVSSVSAAEELQKLTSAADDFFPERSEVWNSSEPASPADPTAAPSAYLPSDRYRQYTSYQDDRYSTVDSQKAIHVNESQVTLTQEQNSQYIPFEMPRYSDGVDLMNMTIQIHFVNKDGEEYYSDPVNVASNQDTIRFGWLTDEHVTYLSGLITFEIVAIGQNEKGDTYIWKTRPDGKFNVMESLNGNGIIKPDADWYSQFVVDMDQKVLRAANSAREAAAYAADCQDAAASIDSAKDAVQEVIDSAAESMEAEIRSSLKQTLSGFYTKAEVDALLENLDLSDFMTQVEQKIESIDGLADLKITYHAASHTIGFYNGETLIVSHVLNTNPDEVWTAQYTEQIEDKILSASAELDEKIASAAKAASDVCDALKTFQTEAAKTAADLKNTDTRLSSDLTGVNTGITDLNAGLSALESKVNELDGAKNPNEYEATYEENLFTLWENGEVKNQFTITGGSGSADTSTVTIERITADSSVILAGSAGVIEYRFSSVDNTGDATGNGTASWKVGSTVVASSTVLQGKNSFDLTAYLKTGANSVRLTVTDSFGTAAAKTWTITVVDLKLESSFDDSLFYSGDVTFRYTPYGDISKQIRFKLDGETVGTVTTPVTGRQMTQTIPARPHGSHLLEVTITAEIEGQTVQSKSLFRDILWISPSESAPAIGCAIPTVSAKQYNTVTIPYVIYDPENNPAEVTLWEDGILLSSLTVGRVRQIWSYRASSPGEKTLSIQCGDTIKTIHASIEELGIDISPVTANLAFDFNPSGKNNHDSDRLWTDGTNRLDVSDNFDWTNGGYQTDGDGDTYFCVKAGTEARIDYPLFADDAKKTGKNFKFIYRCTNVRDYDARVLSCFQGGIGFQVFAQNAVLTSEQNRIDVPFCEDNYMELEFNILPDSHYTEMVLWLDGIPSRVQLYSASDSFTQAQPAVITIGSEDCDVRVYRMKSYTMNLTDDEILDNHIADAKNADEMLSRYLRNDILDSSGGLDPDLLAEKCPDLRIIKIETPRFTTGKKDKVSVTSFQQIYKNGRAANDNWVSPNGILSGQGTSSEYYGESGRNLDLNCSGGFTFADGTTAETYGMTDRSVPVSYFNIKVNIASSENSNNSGMAEEYNQFNPYLRQARKDDPRVRDTMEFHPCVVFVKETDPDHSVEFHDGQWHFYACGNIGNSKKNSEAMGMDPDNHKEFIVEISNNTDPQCRFLSDDLSGELWDGDTSFEMRYENPDCTPKEAQAGKDAWQALLTWVVNADPETFQAEFQDHFIKDSLLFYYLFTERHTLVDNRAKNTFWHTEDLIHWDLCFDYDNDTAMGNDNEGGLTLTYGCEDTDTIGNKSVFNASDSKVFCYIRDYMQDDLKELFIRLESLLAWSSSRILANFEAEQNLKPERLWIMDMRRKYFRTYEENGTTSYLPMMHGSKKHQRRQFQYYQEKYISSKYAGSACTSDVMTIRGYTPIDWTGVKPDGTFHIIPYADTYLVNRFGSNLTKVRAKRGQTYEIKSPIAAMNDTEVYTYNASLIQSVGDIAPFYPGYCDFNQGVKLTDLTVGSGTEGYQNTNMTDFGIGRNILLEHLNLQNLPNLKKTVSLADCTNLTEFLADGSGITGVIFADGGKIRTARLPAVSSITGKNLYYLTDLAISDYSGLTTLLLENCPSVDELTLLLNVDNLSRVRLTQISWNLPSADLLERLTKLAGIDENGYHTKTSVLSGSVHVPVMKEKRLAAYRAMWPDLTITYDSLILQYTVTFVNEDGTVLDVQSVDKGADAEDPFTRETDPIAVPTKESTVGEEFRFSGWDIGYTSIFADRVITAVYTASVRVYTVRWLSKGAVLQETEAEYGTCVQYSGEIPVYTAEESAYSYYLFDRWDSSGYVTGNKDITAVFDRCVYNEGYFKDRELSSLRPAELYVMAKLGLESETVDLKDALTIRLGHDYSYDDVQETVLIEEKTVFDGTNHIDTGLSLMEEDRDFVLALDYVFDSASAANSVLAQCYQSDGSEGFRLWYSNGAKITWGTQSAAAGYLNREMLVVRHRRGENGLHVYQSNLSGELSYQELSMARTTRIRSTLVFGCSKADDGAYENYSRGIVSWCKIWYADLGDGACRKLASWPHEELTLEMCGLKRYYLSDDSGKRCSMSFLASHLLERTMPLSLLSTNEGGFEACSLKTYLNTRFYDAFPDAWRQLLKNVKILSSKGSKSKEIVTSNCYIAIPAAVEADSSMSSEPYSFEGTSIPYLTANASRKRSLPGSEESSSYWLRSPNASYSSYFYRVDEEGNLYGYYSPGTADGVLVMLSV